MDPYPSSTICVIPVLLKNECVPHKQTASMYRMVVVVGAGMVVVMEGCFSLHKDRCVLEFGLHDSIDWQWMPFWSDI